MVDKETHPTIYKHHQNLNLFTISNRKNICIKDISIFDLLSNISLQVSSVINLISKLLFKANPLLNLTFIISSNINHSHRSKKKIHSFYLFIYLYQMIYYRIIILKVSPLNMVYVMWNHQWLLTIRPWALSLELFD